MRDRVRPAGSVDCVIEEVPASRAGAPWTQDEIDQMIGQIRRDQSIAQVAAALGRTQNAVLARIRMLVPPQAPTDPWERVAWLRDRLREGAYEWRTHYAAHAGPPLWSNTMDQVLCQAWDAGTPTLEQLACVLRFSEQILVRQFLRLGLATDVVEVTDRLSCTPGGVIAARRAIALGDAYSFVHVLVVLDETGLRHVSVHPDQDTAQRHASQVEAAMLARVGRQPQTHILRRLPGATDIPRRITTPTPTAPPPADTASAARPAGRWRTWWTRRPPSPRPTEGP